MPVIYSPSGAVKNLLELISLLFLSRIVTMRRRMTRDLIKSVARGVICVHNKKRIPWLGDNENYSERRYSDAVSLSFQAHNFGQREYNRSRSGPRLEGLKRPIFNRSLQANRHIDSAARSNQIKSSSY